MNKMIGGNASNLTFFVVSTLHVFFRPKYDIKKISTVVDKGEGIRVYLFLCLAKIGHLTGNRNLNHY